MNQVMLYENPVALGILSAYRDEFEVNMIMPSGTEGYIWRSKDGRRTPVSQMHTQHIKNCIRAIERDDGTVTVPTRVLSVLRQELQDRDDEYPF